MRVLAEDYERYLVEEDAATRQQRAARASDFLEVEERPSWQMLPGGPLSFTAYWEARHAYVQGLYLGCVLLCQTCVEHLLSGLLILSGDEGMTDRYAKALSRARDRHLLSEAEFDLFDRLRRQRNPYTHPRGPMHESALIRRAVASDLDPEELLRRDALEALDALGALLKRKPFRWEER